MFYMCESLKTFIRGWGGRKMAGTLPPKIPDFILTNPYSHIGEGKEMGDGG